ncbi:MAG: hypothetical protein ACOZBX_05855, partial [Campylobacterota bacterium]
AVHALQEVKMEPGDLETSGMSIQERRYVLEAAAELVEYRYIEGKIPKEVYAKRYHALLSQRALLGKGEPLVVDEKANPDTSHNAARIRLAKGWGDERSPVLIGWRPAFHDLEEDDTGHLAGAQIEFLDTLLGVEDSKVTLEKFTLLSLASIAPVSRFFKPFSWRMKSGWDREYGGDRLSFVTRVGAGAALGEDRLYGYLLSEPEVRLGFDTDAGIGLCVGGGITWTGRMKTSFEAARIGYIEAPWKTKISFLHLWQWGSGGNLFAAYEIHDQHTREERIRFGTNLYF